MHHRLTVYCGILWIIVSIILLNSCTDEINMYASTKTVPIVYCLLDPDSSFQYVRIGQTFYYEGDESTIHESGITRLDEDFDLYITYKNNDGEDKLVWFYPFNGFIRDTGLFPEEELQILTAELSIEFNTQYKLYLHLKESDYIVYGELTSFNRKFDVFDPLQADFRTINLYTDEDYFFRFSPVAPKAVYQSIMYFNFTEFIDNQSFSKSIPFVMDLSFGEERDHAFVEQRLSGEYFLREIGRKLEAEDNIVRVATGFDFQFSAGGEELYYLIKMAHQQFGFSALSTSNLDNATGVFSSLSREYVKGILPSIHTVDSLAYSKYTNHLGFLPYSENDHEIK